MYLCNVHEGEGGGRYQRYILQDVAKRFKAADARVRTRDGKCHSVLQSLLQHEKMDIVDCTRTYVTACLCVALNTVCFASTSLAATRVRRS